MTKPIHEDLLRYFDGVQATTIDAIGGTPGSHPMAWERARPSESAIVRWTSRMRRRASIGMGLHWMRREGWAEITMIQHVDGPHPGRRSAMRGAFVGQRCPRNYGGPEHRNGS